MNRRRVYLFSLTALLLSVLSTAGFAGYTSLAQETKTPETFAGDAALKNVANYRQWTRVNDVPLPVSFSLVSGALLSRAYPSAGIWTFYIDDSGSDVTRIYQSNGTTRIIYAPPPDRTPVSKPEKDTNTSHENSANSFGVVYVNEVARRSLVEEKKPRFPIGSVIVREKLLQASDAVPQVLVVMVKRERGFNRKANDWEFLMIDGGLSKILRREKTGECRNCHKQQKENDFVFRTYLSEDVRRSQK